MKQGTFAAVMAATAVLAVPGAAHAADYQDAVLADGPLSYWRLDEATGSVAQDATANDRDGTYGNATLGAAAPFITAGTAVTLPKTGSVAGTVGAQSGLVELWLNASKLKKDEQAGIAAHGIRQATAGRSASAPSARSRGSTRAPPRSRGSHSPARSGRR